MLGFISGFMVPLKNHFDEGQLEGKHCTRQGDWLP